MVAGWVLLCNVAAWGYPCKGCKLMVVGVSLFLLCNTECVPAEGL